MIALARHRGVAVKIRPVKISPLPLLLSVFIGTSVSVIHAGLPPGTIMTTGTAHSHRVSARVSDMALCPPANVTADTQRDLPEAGVATENSGETRRHPPQADVATKGSSGVATEQREPSGSGLSQPGPNFDGLHVSELLGDDCSIEDFASDDSGAVGFDHYVQVVNTAMAVYDKTGNLVAGPISGETFWSNQPDCGGTQNWSDAIVRFDRYANRWIISRPGAGRK